LTIYDLAPWRSRLSASWMEAMVTKLARLSARLSKSLAGRPFCPNQQKVPRPPSGVACQWRLANVAADQSSARQFILLSPTLLKNAFLRGESGGAKFLNSETSVFPLSRVSDRRPRFRQRRRRETHRRTPRADLDRELNREPTVSPTSTEFRELRLRTYPSAP
jgi:hypothetical protein